MNVLESPAGTVRAHAVIGSRTNRISIPFFRVPERKCLLGAVDVLLVGGWFLLAHAIWRALAHPGHDQLAALPWDWAVGGSAVWLLVSWLAGAYELDVADRFRSAARITCSVAFASGIVAFAAYYTFLKTYPRPALGIVLLAVPASVLGWRALYAGTLRRPASAIRILVVGNSALCSALLEATAGQEDYFRVLGFVSEGESTNTQYLGAPGELSAIMARMRVHRLVVAPRQSLPHQLVAVLSNAIEQGIEVVDFNAAYEEIAGKVSVEHAGDYWLAALPTCSSTSSLENVAIRLVDLVGATVGLVLTCVLAPGIAAVVLIESGWPLIYRQVRLGRGGVPFTIYKFRTMRPDAEANGAQWATPSDMRATRVGRFLRRTHLDELPQFWNVLAGDMSLVGPRPERPSFTHELADTIPFYRLRLAVRPGLTGLKQIRFGYAATVDEHLEVLRHDLYYIKHRSISLNLSIMARTVGSVIGRDGR